MTTVIDFKKMTLKEIDLLWQNLDLELERQLALERGLQEHYNKLVGAKAKDATGGLIKGVQSAIVETLRRQALVEEYLIENEAPGWTSS